MSDEDTCPNGNDCAFGDKHELAFTTEIMGVIGRYIEDEQIDACPLCLRNTMLAVAALLHIEGTAVAGAKSGKPSVGGKRLNKEFTEAANKRLKAVVEANAIRIARIRH